MDKEELFLNTLQLLLMQTRAGSDICSLNWFKTNDDKFIVITFKGGYTKKVCVTADSELAMIQDVCRALY